MERCVYQTTGGFHIQVKVLIHSAQPILAGMCVHERKRKVESHYNPRVLTAHFHRLIDECTNKRYVLLNLWLFGHDLYTPYAY